MKSSCRHLIDKEQEKEGTGNDTSGYRNTKRMDRNESDIAIETILSQKSAGPTSLRVVLLADDLSLQHYGPVLRRLSVGLIDEVSDLSLLCAGASDLLPHVPSPPVRIITETRGYSEESPDGNMTTRQLSIVRPCFDLYEYLLPQRRINRIAETLQPFKPTLFHALSERQALLARRLSKRMGIPYVLSILSVEPSHLNFSQHRCGAILAGSSHLTRKMRRLYPRLAARMHYMPIGTHVTETPSCFSHEGKVATLFCSCPLEKDKGLPVLLLSIKKLQELGHIPQLMIAGNGSDEYLLRNMVRQLKVSDQVHFIPPIKTLTTDNDAYKAVFKTVDIYVQPCPAKMWQPELLEAMSVGNAVVVADQEKNDLIQQGKTALTVGFQQNQDLTKALHQLLSDRPYARTLATHAQDYLRKHFLASHMISRMVRTYRQAVTLKVKP